jgi:Uma2 family endonuclease
MVVDGMRWYLREGVNLSSEILMIIVDSLDGTCRTTISAKEVYMPQLQRRLEEHFTYGDYRTWPDDERWELIDGVAYDMSPAPGFRHQMVSSELVAQLVAHLRDSSCRVLAAPFDVRLPRGDEADDAIDTVVQPDLVVVCDKKKLDEKGCKGAPDLVIEILSPSTSSKDLHEKYELYERVGVKEYWIVHSLDRTVIVFRRDSDSFGRPAMFAGEDRIEVPLLGELVVDLNLVFGSLE